ncbi:MAG TPA: LysR substrate-binding domain-containing protein [Burkholderiaceae bacterium]|nr:LysR substrate-binding domain-containing protein [Burkholderiaceae bacterium]HRA77401.1 LysR substrate-binding domain-containing protein [Burkholderiaceae bacterium]
MKRNVTLRQFRYFIGVAESSSVAAAARMLNIAQSAITKSILELEEDLGVKLFERSTKGMLLTADGHRFLASARRVLATVADATRLLHAQPQALTGSLSIGVTSLVAGYYLAELLTRFRRVCPDVTVQVIEEEPPFLEHLLVNGEVDVAIMISNALSERQALVSETLTRSPNRVWLPGNHPLSARDEVSLVDCAAHEQIVLAAERIEEIMRAVWARYGLKPRVLLKTSSLEAVRSLVGAGVGIAVLPDFLYRPWTLDAQHVDVRKLRDDLPTVDVGLVWRRGSAVKDPVSEFIELAREQSRSRQRRTAPPA